MESSENCVRQDAVAPCKMADNPMTAHRAHQEQQKELSGEGAYADFLSSKQR
jgi:hypothetical protein